MASCRELTPVPLDLPRISLTAYPPITWVDQTPTPVPLTSTPGITLTPVILSPSPASSATITPSLTPAFRLCSPLAWETIPELREIISDPYNPPPSGRDERHQGIDFSHYSRKGHNTIEGEPVQAVLTGGVAAVIQNRLPYGNMVMIETSSDDLPITLRNALGMAEGKSLYLLYAHFGHIPQVNVGERVQCGQVIGDVGMTGYYIFNPHLHLEERTWALQGSRSKAWPTTPPQPLKKRWKITGAGGRAASSGISIQ